MQKHLIRLLASLDRVKAMAGQHPEWKDTEPFKSVLANDMKGILASGKQGKLLFVDDKAGKPVGIYRHIGRRPIFAAGNSDGDQQMLEYTTIARGPDDTTPRFDLIVHHTDAEREYAYDRESHIGQLNTALGAAPECGWLVVDMKKDWNRIYPGMHP